MADDEQTAHTVSLALIEWCTAVNPDDSVLLADLGARYEAANRVEEAEQVYERVLAIDADDADVRLRLARLQLCRGVVEGARAHLQAALEVQPNRQELMEVLAPTANASRQERPASVRLPCR